MGFEKRSHLLGWIARGIARSVGDHHQRTRHQVFCFNLELSVERNLCGLTKPFHRIRLGECNSVSYRRGAKGLFKYKRVFATMRAVAVFGADVSVAEVARERYHAILATVGAVVGATHFLLEETD